MLGHRGHQCLRSIDQQRLGGHEPRSMDVSHNNKLKFNVLGSWFQVRTCMDFRIPVLALQCPWDGLLTVAMVRGTMILNLGVAGANV